MATKGKIVAQNAMTVMDFLKDLTVREDDEVVETSNLLIESLYDCSKLQSEQLHGVRGEFAGLAWANENRFNFLVHNYIPGQELKLTQTSKNIMGEDELDIFKTSNESKPHINDEVHDDRALDATIKGNIDDHWGEVRVCAIKWYLFRREHDKCTAILNGDADDSRMYKGNLPVLDAIGEGLQAKANKARDAGEAYRERNLANRSRRVA